MSEIPISIVVAASEDGVIGRGGDMPWKLSTDLKRFKALTLGKPVVLGRKTYESLGSRPLPGRPHVVVTRSADIAGGDAVEIAGSLEEGIRTARHIAEQTGAAEICIIGGGEIYRQAMTIADTLYVTHVEAAISDGDTFFPTIDPAVFEKREETLLPAGEKDSYPTRFAVYVRRPAAN